MEPEDTRKQINAILAGDLLEVREAFFSDLNIFKTLPQLPNSQGLNSHFLNNI